MSRVRLEMDLKQATEFVDAYVKHQKAKGATDLLGMEEYETKVKELAAAILALPLDVPEHFTYSTRVMACAEVIHETLKSADKSYKVVAIDTLHGLANMLERELS